MLKSLVAAALALALIGCGGGGSGDGGNTVVDQRQSGAEQPGVSAEKSSPVLIYGSSDTAAAGEQVSFHVSDFAGRNDADRPVRIEVFRVGRDSSLVTAADATARRQPMPDAAWVDCCEWPNTWTMTVDPKWPSGLYRIVATIDGSAADTWLVVRQATPGSTARNVLQIPFLTAAAYNNFGGKSLEDATSAQGRVERVSLRRPNARMGETVANWIGPFINWAERQNMPLEYIASTDLHRNPAALAPYKLFITVGHDAYWSTPMRDTLENFSNAGNNIVILGGNTSWWRVEFAADANGAADRIMVSTKQRGSTTGTWFDTRATTPLTGQSGRRGGALLDPSRDFQLTERAFRVTAAGHWLYSGTGLAGGGEFGGPSSGRLLQSFTDALDFSGDATQGPVQPTGADGVAADRTRILALGKLDGWAARDADASDLTGQPGAWAAITEYQQRGTVLNFGTADWARALLDCSGAANIICTMTRNAMVKLGDAVPATVPAEPAVDPDIVAVMRYWQPDPYTGKRYLYTTQAELIGSEWKLEDRAFFAFRAQKPGTAPVWRYYANQADASRRYMLAGGDDAPVGPGWTRDRVVFYAYVGLAANRILVNEFYQVAENGWHMTYGGNYQFGAPWRLAGPNFAVPENVELKN